MKQNDTDRFLGKVGEPDENGCRHYKGGVSNDGYGKFWLDGKQVGAHRIAWLVANGDSIPSDQQVCHTCDVRDCIEPSHLFLGTVADNAHDRDAKGRTAIMRGSKHGGARLTEQDVLSARALRSLLGWKVNTIAALFGISRSHMSSILSNKYWAHI